SLPSNLPVHSLCEGLPSAPTPSTITFTLSPAASYTTVVFFGAPAPILDLASSSFQVPIFTSSAATHTAAAATSTAKLNKPARAFINLLCAFFAFDTERIETNGLITRKHCEP